MNTWRESEQTGNSVTDKTNRTLEHPKFVWNGDILNDDDIRWLVCSVPLELLEPFLVQVPEKTLVAGNTVYLS